MSATEDDGIRDLVALFANADDVQVCFFTQSLHKFGPQSDHAADFRASK